MQPRDLPSLTALAAFEAAARHLSFKQAANELNVTAPAVSRQIRALEENLNTALFVRAHRQVGLTAEGHLLYDSVAHAFRSIGDAARTVSNSEFQQVRVGSTNAVASYWLIPRLGDFWRQQPDVNFNHVISDQTINLAAARADLAIRFGRGDWPGLDSRLLFPDRIYPVCSRSFLKRLGKKTGSRNGLEILTEAPLLDVGDVREEGWLGWADWFRGVGLTFTPRNLRTFNSYIVTVQAAMDGLGIALGWDSLVRDDVAEGRLVVLSDYVLEAEGGFYLVTQKDKPLSSGALLFVNWLVAQAGDYRQIQEARQRQRRALSRADTKL